MLMLFICPDGTIAAREIKWFFSRAPKFPGQTALKPDWKRTLVDPPRLGFEKTAGFPR
jgi:hypothetical protein